jgi:Protein of unknown function (DUF1569)
MKNIFAPQTVRELVARLEQLTPDTPAEWGKMSVAQMLAHCNVTYEMVYDDIHPKPNVFKRFLLTMLVKNTVVNEKPYKRNSPTAAEFIIKSDKDFAAERARLITHLEQTQQLGEAHFDGKMSHSFGKLSKTEWNNLFYKHLDHHLTQFGV